MGTGTSLASGERGVSNVVATVLLIGLTLVGITVILATGYLSIGETNQQANMEIAEETMLQIESVFQQNSGGNTTISFPDQLEGQVSVSNDQSYALVLDGNSECSTGSRNLSSVAYEQNGQAVAYEGGGVWRMTESGATMVSPPDVTYDQGSLSVSLVEIEGQLGTRDELRATTNTTRQRIHQRNMSLAMYTDRNYTSPPDDGNLDFVCRPSQVENATLRIENSQYARAWAAWAQDNYDTDLVSVTPPESVDAGDTVSITYQLGDVSDSHFSVSNVRVTRQDPSSPLNVTANVTNTGGLRARKAVRLEYGSVNRTRTVGIAGGESKQVNFTVDVGDITTGTETVTVSSPDDSASESLTLSNTNSVPAVELDTASMPTEVGLRANPDVDVTVENTGTMTAFERVRLRKNGVTIATWDVVVDPGDSVDVPVGASLPTAEAGRFELAVSGAIAPAAESRTIDPFRVGNTETFSIRDTSGPLSVRSGDTATLSAEIANPGDTRRTSDVTLRLAESGTNHVVFNETRSVTLDGSLGGTNVQTVSWQYTATNGTGMFNYTVSTPGATSVGQFRVGPPLRENVLVTGTEVSPNPVVKGNETTVRVEVANTGTQTATQTVELRNTDTRSPLRDQTVTLDPGESQSLTWDILVDDPEFDYGNNELSISTANTTSLRNLDVRDAIPRITDTNGEITVNVASRVRITMEGAELEGRVGGGEYPNPTVMTLVIENESGTYERTLWDDVPETGPDVNHPLAERAMQREAYPNVYNETFQVERNTTLALYANSYGCRFDRLVFSTSDYDFTGVVHPDRLPESLGSTNGYVCEDDLVTDDPIVSISNETNPDNVAIFGDGERLPAYQQASPYQLGLDAMLGDRVDDGRLSLRSDERVFLFELSQENANPANAGSEGDPDYNDAVARFEVASVSRAETTPAEFIITDYDVPAQVEQGDDATLNVTVANIGGETASTAVRTTFDGDTSQRTTGELATGHTETLRFTLDAGSLPLGSYEWRTNATASNGAVRSGYLGVGEPAVPEFLVSVGTDDPVVDTEDTPRATVEVSNTGSVTGTQPIVLEVRNESAATPTWRDTNSTTLTLASNQTTSTRFDLPTAPGNYRYRVSTDNVTTSSLPLVVGRTNVYPDSIWVRFSNYDIGSLVDRTGYVENMTVELWNDGTVGDEREVRLTLTNSSGAEVFDRTKTRDLGGNNRLSDVYTANLSFQPQLSPGYYNYTVTVYNDTSSSSNPSREFTGAVYVRSVGSGATDPEDSPIDVNTGTITVG